MAEDACAALETTGKVSRDLLRRLRKLSRSVEVCGETQALLDEIPWRQFRKDEADKAEVRARSRQERGEQRRAQTLETKAARARVASE